MSKERLLQNTRPDIASMLLRKEEGLIFRDYERKQTDWVCPNCGKIIKNKYVNNIANWGLCCPLCSNTRSLGHRIVNSVLDTLHIDYDNEKMFKWADNKFYDIYIEDISCIVEVNGIQHYEYCGIHKKARTTLKDTQENDKYKMQCAIKNGIKNYIYVDARKSSYEYIIENLKTNKEFSQIIDISNIDWNEVKKKTFTLEVNKIKDLYNSGMGVCEIATTLKIGMTKTKKVISSLADVELCDYSGDYNKPVICITTGKHFNSITEASLFYHISDTSISAVCRHKRNRKHAGKLEDGTKLQWCFLNDIDSIQKSQNVCKKPVGAKKVVCLNTGEIFSKINDAKRKYPSAKSISDCCRHIARSTGNLNGVKMKWLYYEEYLTLSEDEINKVLNDNKYDEHQIICITTGEIFNGYKEASKKYKLNYQYLFNAINYCNTKFVGRHPVSNERLEWSKYVETNLREMV